MHLNIEEQRELLKRGFSRRNFGRFATVITAGAALPFYNESAMAQLSMIKGPMPTDAVKINANQIVCNRRPRLRSGRTRREIHWVEGCACSTHEDLCSRRSRDGQGRSER